MRAHVHPLVRSPASVTNGIAYRERRPCFICGQLVTSRFYCWGCDEYVCNACDCAAEEIGSQHAKEVHRG